MTASRRRLTSLLVLSVFFLAVLLWRSSSLESYTDFRGVEWFHSKQAASNPYTAAIVYLVNGRRRTELVDSLLSVHVNFTSDAWPIILMHPGDFDNVSDRDSLISQVLEKSDSREFTNRVEFVRVNFTIPPEINTDLDVLDPVFRKVWPGYHQMCQFYTHQIFDLPRLKDVTYYMRLDSDSYINSKACFDPFKRMYNQNLSYAYKETGSDPGYVVRGMWAFMDDYVRRHPSLDAQLTKNQFRWPSQWNRDHEWFSDERDAPIWAYYNSFEIVKLESFRTREVKEWLDELASEPERFFKYRWGDAPLRYLTVSMFLDMDTETSKFCDMPYLHQGSFELCECQE